jgi:phage terminase large subunit-like protein
MANRAELHAKLETVRRLRDEAEHDWDAQARPDQLEPDGNWTLWVLAGGRGAGKSRALSETLRRRVRLGIAGQSAIIGPTASSVRDVMVEGPSGVLACCTEAERPRYEPSKRRLEWPNGARTSIFSADEPDRLGGPQHDFIVADELRAWRYLSEAIDNAFLGLRMGPDPRMAAATTPSGRPELRALLARPGTVVTRASTYANLANLSAGFRDTIRFYEGSRLARAELHGEFLEDVEGALFERAWIERNRVDQVPHPVEVRRTIVALDPADGTGTGAEAALCAASMAADGHVYVIRSEGQRSSPFEYLTHAVRVADELGATIVVERNFGGRPLLELLERAMDECGIRRPYQEVWVHHGKRIRAQDMAVLAETGRLHFVGRDHALLEDQLCTWVEGEKSPDRLDAAAHAVNTLRHGYVAWRWLHAYVRWCNRVTRSTYAAVESQPEGSSRIRRGCIVAVPSFIWS